jgi:hypothetical protein
MVTKPTSIFRAGLACVLIACTLFVAFALVTGNHEHSVSHCCAFCHFGQLPCVEVAQAPKILPPIARQGIAVPEHAGHAVDRDAITSFGRAPPAC